MTDIDWSKAPEGATHYGAESDSYCEAWYRVESGKIVQYAEAANAMAVLKPAREAECYYHCIDDLIALWTGEGLPPVGTVCEMRDDLGVWHRATVIAHGVERGEAVGIGQADDLLLWCKADHHCRPIRTPEQIAAEEREKAIDAMVKFSPLMDKQWSRLVCAALYNAGCRLPEGSAP